VQRALWMQRHPMMGPGRIRLDGLRRLTVEALPLEDHRDTVRGELCPNQAEIRRRTRLAQKRERKMH